MERLKEENAFAAAAAVVSPSMSFGGSLGGVASARSRQVRLNCIVGQIVCREFDHLLGMIFESLVTLCLPRKSGFLF